MKCCEIDKEKTIAILTSREGVNKKRSPPVETGGLF